MPFALLLSLSLAQSPVAGQAAAPSDGAEREAVEHLKGFDLSLTLYNSSGIYFGPGGYSNTLSVWLEPTWHFGRAFFKDTWFSKLFITARLPLEAQVVGNDPGFNRPRFQSGAILNPGYARTPEAAAILRGQSSGTDTSPVVLGDMFLGLGHGRLFTIPGLKIDVSSVLRVAIPTSVGSRNAGLLTALGLGLIFERTLFERLSLGYMVRPTKFFYSRTQSGIAKLDEPVVINGKPEPTWTPSSTGEANANFSVLNGVWASLELPKGFSVSLNYFLFNEKPYDVVGGCNPIGVVGVDVCSDGQAVGPARPGAWRNDQWFLASVDFHHSFWALSLGLSTYRPLRNPDGSLAQPFGESNRNNFSTVYLSFSATAEGIAAFAVGAVEKKP